MNRPLRTATGHPSGEAAYQRDDIDVSSQDFRPPKRRRFRKTRLFIAVLLMVSALGAAYLFAIPSRAAYYTVSSGAVSIGITGPGILDATNKVSITSRIPGFLNSLTVDRNDPVKVGQLLAELDARDIRSQVEGARADVEAAKSAVAEAIGNRDKARAGLEKANKDLERRRSLPTGIVSQVELESLEIAVRQATAEYERSAAVEDRSRAQVKVAEAAVGVLEHKLGETQIRSPLNGLVVSRDRSVGDLLSAGIQLTQVVDPTSIIISTRLDESVMGAIEPGQAAKVRFTSDPANPIDAKVMRVGRTVDLETREFIVDLIPGQLPKNWALGQRSHVSIEIPLPRDSMTVPLNFVDRREGRAGVWRPIEKRAISGSIAGRAAWVPVETGAVSGTHIQVLQGLKPGDVILHPKGRYPFEPIALSETRQ